MGTDGPVVEYRGEEVFRPLWKHAVTGTILAICSTAMFVTIFVVRIYFGHRGGDPISLLVVEMAEFLWGSLVGVWMATLAICGFVRVSNDGIERRRIRKVWKIGWEEITAVEFMLRRREVIGIRIYRGGGVKPLKLGMGVFFSRESREQVEMRIRGRVPQELQIERNVGRGLKASGGRK